MARVLGRMAMPLLTATPSGVGTFREYLKDRSNDMAGMQLGDNISATEKDGVITLHLDTTNGGTLSASEKNLTLASTRGNKTFRLSTGETVTIGVNCYQPPAPAKMPQG